MKQIISEYMAKSIILHVYEPFEKKASYFNLVSNYSDMNIKTCEQFYNELEASEEIDKIRIPQNIETKKATEFFEDGTEGNVYFYKICGNWRSSWENNGDLMEWVEGRKYL